MIRTLLIIAGAALVLCLASLAGAAALGGKEFAARGYSWTFTDSDGEQIRVERAAADTPTVTRSLPWAGGERLNVDIPGHVIFTQGREVKVEITGPQSVAERVRLEGDRLFLANGDETVTFSMRNGIQAWSESERLTVRITAPSVKAFELNGSGDLDISDYEQDRLAIVINGSGDVDASGKAATVDLSINGSGEANLSDTSVTDATVAVSGSGEAWVGPTGRATVNISGSGDVNLTQRPANLNSQINGSGKVHQD